MVSNRSSTPLRNWWVRVFPDLPQDVRRPAVFVLLFWTCWVATLASHAFGLLDAAPTFGLLPVVLALLALVALWATLPWSQRTDPRRMLLAPAFLGGTFVVGYLTELNLSIVFYALVVANGVFLFGFRKGVAYSVLTMPVFFANVALVDGLEMALMATAIAVPFAVFIVGICAAVVEAAGFGLCSLKERVETLGGTTSWVVVQREASPSMWSCRHSPPRWCADEGQAGAGSHRGRPGARAAGPREGAGD